MSRKITGLLAIGLLVLTVVIMNGCAKDETVVPTPIHLDYE